MKIITKKFVAYFYHPPKGWWYIQLGFHVDLSSPNIEIHVPFGFFRIGIVKVYSYDLGEDDRKGIFKWGIEKTFYENN